MMTNDESNWENEIDWSCFNPPAGGREFYDFLKASLPKLDASIAELRADFDRETERIAQWGEVARRFDRLHADFTAIAESELYTRMIAELDGKTRTLFGGNIPTIGEWLKWGERFTNSLRVGSAVPDGWRQAKAKAERKLAIAENLRRFVSLYVTTSEKDYRLRFAPIRLRTKLFRDIVKDVSAFLAAGEALERETDAEMLKSFWPRVRDLVDIARRTQKACRQIRKVLDREGERYWRETADCGLLAATA